MLLAPAPSCQVGVTHPCRVGRSRVRHCENRDWQSAVLRAQQELEPRHCPLPEVAGSEARAFQGLSSLQLWDLGKRPPLRASLSCEMEAPRVTNLGAV